MEMTRHGKFSLNVIMGGTTCMAMSCLSMVTPLPDFIPLQLLFLAYTNSGTVASVVFCGSSIFVLQLYRLFFFHLCSFAVTLNTSLTEPHRQKIF